MQEFFGTNEGFKSLRFEQTNEAIFPFSFSLDEKETKNQAKNIVSAPHRKLRFLRSPAHKPEHAKILFSSFTSSRLQFLAGPRTGCAVCASRISGIFMDFFGADTENLKATINRGAKNPQPRARDGAACLSSFAAGLFISSKERVATARPGAQIKSNGIIRLTNNHKIKLSSSRARDAKGLALFAAPSGASGSGKKAEAIAEPEAARPPACRQRQGRPNTCAEPAEANKTEITTLPPERIKRKWKQLPI